MKKPPSLAYYFRIDDVCPEMNWGKFMRLVGIFKKNELRPIIGVIPENKDPNISPNVQKEDFWKQISLLAQSGWIVAQHGYQHVYKTKDSGMLRINPKSEFAGVPYLEQLDNLKRGREIIKKALGFYPAWFMAPAHSLDKNTCKALVDLGFTHITDGIALFPYRKLGLMWVPQQLWRPTKKNLGHWTVCLHPNTMQDTDFIKLERFIKENIRYISNFNPGIRRGHVFFANKIYSMYWYIQFTLFKIWKRII